MTRRRRRKYVASENGVEDDSQESGNDTENDSQETESSIALKRPPPFTLKIPVNIVRPLKCTGHSSWNVLNAFGTITTRFALHAITRSPRRGITLKRAFFGFTIVEQLHTKTRRRWKPNFIPLLKRRTKEKINFIPFKSLCILITFFVTGFNKVFKTLSLVSFYCMLAFIGRVFQLILVVFVFIIICQGSPLGF